MDGKKCETLRRFSEDGCFLAGYFFVDKIKKSEGKILEICYHLDFCFGFYVSKKVIL